MDAILNNLCKISELRVLSRSSSEKYRDSKLSAKEIAKELEVNYILEGSVQKYEDKVRITIQLIDATEDKLILSEPYDRDYKDLLNLQSEIAQEIAGKLNVILSNREKELIEKPVTTNMAAYELYMKGREYASLYNNMTYNYQQQYLNEAIRLYNEAIQIDPEFALAYVGLGELCVACYQWDLFNPKVNFADSVNRIIEHLQKFIKSGFLGFAMTYLDIHVNPMFDNIRETKEFKSLLKEGEAQITKKREDVRKLEEQGLL